MPTSLSPGTRLGPYEIVASIGAGGMGEVYRARDTRLERSVAIKFLHHEFASDPDRRIRFEREARVIAGLSHPNICALHDVGSTPASSGDDAAYLVMEYIDGETLDRRIARGPLPLKDTVRIATEIARGLEAAHRQRIVHRDLKPSNIMLTRAGVKILDFGLARATGPGADSAAGSTVAATAVTAPGTVLGTVPYMAPEQIEGKMVDARGDIFALGCVIYEMATGRRAFEGASPAAVASAILSSEPPPLAASASLDRIVRGCLRKDPDQRWQSAQDVGMQVEGVTAGDEQPSQRLQSASWLPWLLAAAALVVAVVASLAWSASRQAHTAAPEAGRVVALSIPPPNGLRFSTFVEYSFVAVSPDGNSIAYVVTGPGKPRTLWVRPVSSTEARQIAGTEGAISAFWSPDSRSLGFFANGFLKRVELTGDRAPVPLCPTMSGLGLTGTWGASGEILFSAVSGGNIMRVRDSGGTPSVAIAQDPQKKQTRVTQPSFLPDGRRFLYLAGGAADHVGTIMLGSLDGSRVEVMRQQSMAQYVEPGFLVFVQDGAIVARRFDADTGRADGAAIPIAPRVNWLHSTGVAQFSASPSGVIAFLQSQDEGRIAAFTRDGREVAEVRSVGTYQNVRVSADGKQMLFDYFDPAVSAYDVWLKDLERGSEERVTSHIGSEVAATWIPGGGFLYTASRGSPPRLHQRRTVTSEEEALFGTLGEMQNFPEISADGQHVVFAQRAENGSFQLMGMTMQERRPERLHPTTIEPETAPRFSPDGTLLAYVSDVSGRTEVYVEPYRMPKDRRTVSAGGGILPRWSRDGDELFYISPTGDLQAVRVTKDPLSVTKPTTVFVNRGPRWADYDVTADERFFAHLVLKVAAEQPFTVLVNWPSLVKQ